MNAARQRRPRRSAARRPPAGARAAGERFDRLFPLVYAALYAAVALAVHLTTFRVGDLGVESDFYAEMGPAARDLWQGRLTVADFPFKGPLTAAATAVVHLFAGPLGADWYRTGVLLNVLCAAGFLVLLYRLLRSLWPRGVAAAATVSVSLVFEFFLHAHKATSDLLFLLLFYASAALLLRAEARPGRLLLAGAVGGLAYLTRYNGLVLPVAALAAGLILWREAPPRRRLGRWALYAAGFLLAAAPWYAVNLAQSGRLLATHNLQNIFVEEFYPAAAAQELPAGAATSLPRLLLHDPLRFLGTWLRNLPAHLWLDLRQTLSWGLSLLFVLGLLRLLAVPLRRGQAALLAFPLLYWLAMALVYHQARFSFPLLPAYAVLAWTVVFGARRDVREAGAGDPAPRDAPPTPADAAARRDLRLALLPPRWDPRRPGARGLLAAAILAGVLFWQGSDARVMTRWYVPRQPTFVLDLAPTLRQLAPVGRQGVLMARKPHAAFYAGLRYQPFPRDLEGPRQLVDFARAHDVDLILVSGIEQQHYPELHWLTALQQVPGVRLVHQDEYSLVYAVAPPGGGGDAGRSGGPAGG